MCWFVVQEIINCDKHDTRNRAHKTCLWVQVGLKQRKREIFNRSWNGKLGKLQQLRFYIGPELGYQSRYAWRWACNIDQDFEIHGTSRLYDVLTQVPHNYNWRPLQKNGDHRQSFRQSIQHAHIEYFVDQKGYQFWYPLWVNVQIHLPKTSVLFP